MPRASARGSPRRRRRRRNNARPRQDRRATADHREELRRVPVAEGVRLRGASGSEQAPDQGRPGDPVRGARDRDRKSTRLNSSHGYISYAVFCLKKKKKKENITT